MSCGCNGPGCDAWGCDGNPQFEWDGSFHDLCPNCDGTAPPHVECICGLLAEAEHRGMARGQQALELLRPLLTLNRRGLWDVSAYEEWQENVTIVEGVIDKARALLKGDA